MKRTTLEFPGEPMVLHTQDVWHHDFDADPRASLQRAAAGAGAAGHLRRAQGDVRANALQLALARGHRWLRQIESGQARNIAEVAKREKVDRSYVSRMINLTALAPDIQAAILNDTLPEAVGLFDLAMNTPLCWAAQRRRIAEVVAGAGGGSRRACRTGRWKWSSRPRRGRWRSRSPSTV
nr:LacI family transcriptional regulator [Ralstonia solanacearum]